MYVIMAELFLWLVYLRLRDIPQLIDAIRHDVLDNLKKFHVGVIAKLADSKFVWSYWFGCMNPSQCSESFLRMKMAAEIFDEKGVNLLAQFDA